MLQHSNLLIKLEGITDLQIGVTNVGEVPIDKIQMKIEGSIQNKPEAKFIKKSKSKTILSPKDTFNIPLFEELEQFLIDQKMLRIHYEEMPTGEHDLFTGEQILLKEKFKHILKPFSMKFCLNTTYTVHDATKKIPKEFVVSYDYIPAYGDPTITGDPECRYSDNYEIRIQETQWSS